MTISSVSSSSSLREEEKYDEDDIYQNQTYSPTQRYLVKLPLFLDNSHQFVQKNSFALINFIESNLYLQENFFQNNKVEIEENGLSSFAFLEKYELDLKVNIKEKDLKERLSNPFVKTLIRVGKFILQHAPLTKLKKPDFEKHKKNLIILNQKNALENIQHEKSIDNPSGKDEFYYLQKASFRIQSFRLLRSLNQYYIFTSEKGLPGELDPTSLTLETVETKANKQAERNIRNAKIAGAGVFALAAVVTAIGLTYFLKK